MKKNMSNLDRGTRIVLAIIFAALYLTGILPGTLGLVLTILGAVFLLTSAIGSCPIYSILGVSTCPVEAKE